MPLTRCRECENEISEAAVACPRCGAHYTVAVGTWHRGFGIGGGISLLATLALRIGIAGPYRRKAWDTRELLGDLSLIFFLLGVALLLVAGFYAAFRGRIFHGRD